MVVPPWMFDGDRPRSCLPPSPMGHMADATPVEPA